MALPELYRFGREGTYFGLRKFLVYMIDGIYQVRYMFLLDQQKSLFTYWSSRLLYTFSFNMPTSHRRHGLTGFKLGYSNSRRYGPSPNFGRLF
jgi:hypothetical protein